jgi:hypothetical protein
MDNEFNAAVARVEEQGKARYGDEHWRVCIDAIGRTVGAAGIAEGDMRRILAQPDPAQSLYVAGKEALLQQSDAGDAQAERLYRELRAQERSMYRKGR